MAEYIEREALLKDIGEERPENWTDSEAERQAENDFYKYREIVEIQPTADVVEVKHGVWQEIDNLVIEHGLPTVKGKTWRCSICGEARKNHTAPDMNYCPNCGAKMDKKEGAEECF